MSLSALPRSKVRFERISRLLAFNFVTSAPQGLYATDFAIVDWYDDKTIATKHTSEKYKGYIV